MVQSAGILLFRTTSRAVEVLLVHPGGPFWGRKDSWSIPKGELEEDEDLLSGAAREFEEEVGVKPPTENLLSLGDSRQNASKTNHIWAVESDFDLKHFHSNTFTMEWPPKSGTMQEFVECDKAAWLSLEIARRKIYKGQVVFIDRLAELLSVEITPEPEQQSLL
jgi:predicted NUDIX family NTP pyrophosphohydrolase